MEKNEDGLIEVGYWWSQREPHLPFPIARSTQFYPVDRVIVDYLEDAPAIHRWRGFSPCRICEICNNGTTCLSDGVYQWPCGLSHYVKEHGVQLDRDFVRHIKRNEVNKFYKHIPNFVGAPAWEPIEFNHIDELIDHSRLKRSIDSFDTDEYTLEMSDNHLMIVLDGGYTWWVLGRIEHPELMDLPEWEAKHRDGDGN